MAQVLRRDVLTSALGVALSMMLPRDLHAGAGSVFNEDQGVGFAALDVALAAARPGNVLTVTGRHVGNFVVSKALALRAGADGMIDDGGAGSALLIEADNVAVEGLTITRSGQLPSAEAYQVFWGPSGVHVRASRARLTGLTVTGNDWGIVVLGREKCEASKCVIEDNRQDGVKILGGRGHLITQNRINRNSWGVRLYPRYNDEPKLNMPPKPNAHDLKTMMAYEKSLKPILDLMSNPEGAEEITIKANEVRGNGMVGVHLFSGSKRCSVLNNDVYLTGRERAFDEKGVAAFWAALKQSGYTVANTGTPPDIGTGIYLSCGTNDNTVAGNHSHNNLGRGLSVMITRTSRFENNLIEGNRSGIWLNQVNKSVLRANRVRDNAEYGLCVDSWMHTLDSIVVASDGNMIVMNQLAGNGTNAYDSSAYVPDRAEVKTRVMQFHETYGLPSVTALDVDAALEGRQLGANRWDDGTVGNYCDDFDEVEEGFRDETGDGIGEVAHVIPSGGHKDRFPLTQDKVQAL